MKRRPIVAPIQIEADALTQFALINLASPPFLENVLVAGKNSFSSKLDRTIPRHRTLFQELSGISLRRRQGLIVADKDDVRSLQCILNLLRIGHRIVVAEGLIELAKIFAAAMRILTADLTLPPHQRSQLSCASAISKIRRGCHNVSFSQLAPDF